jgi:FK506-binding protein 14
LQKQKKNMLLSLICVLAVLCLVLSVSQLEVETTFKPEDCDRLTKLGDHMWMHYTGTIDESSATGEPGAQFDSSIDRGTPFDFAIGKGMVIRGWDEGLLDMCVGEKRTLVIPPGKAYGDGGAGSMIPGGATLKFEVELLNIADAAETTEEAEANGDHVNIFVEIDKDGDQKITKEELSAWFEEQGAELPDGLWETEDKDEDGVISFEEFGGPKGEPMEDDHVDPEAEEMDHE